MKAKIGEDKSAGRIFTETREIKMNVTAYNEDLFRFIENSPTAFHAVSTMADELEKNGFTALKEQDAWKLEKGKKYFVTRNGSSIIAFIMGKKSPVDTGIKITGAHTDSPCLKVKPLPELQWDSMLRIGVEVYGGALLTTWFDRKLNLAGRVTCLERQDNGDDILKNFLINFNRPVAVIPSLAVHFERNSTTGSKVNPQLHIPPLFLLENDGKNFSFEQILMEQINREHSGIMAKDILGFDMNFADFEPPCFAGLNNEFISSPRLDNLISCHACLKSIESAGSLSSSLIVCTDNEEIGSDTRSGARGSFLESVLSRISVTTENTAITAARSMIISMDNAHAVNPSYLEKYEANHICRLNKGPVLKINASKKYASDSQSGAFFKYLCKKADVCCQTFVMRNDIPCGSTIGPAISSKTGIRAVDAGAPTLSMHSIRELTGDKDPFMFFKVIKEFFSMDDEMLLSLT